MSLRVFVYAAAIGSLLTYLGTTEDASWKSLGDITNAALVASVYIAVCSFRTFKYTTLHDLFFSVGMSRLKLFLAHYLCALIEAAGALVCFIAVFLSASKDARILLGTAGHVVIENYPGAAERIGYIFALYGTMLVFSFIIITLASFGCSVATTDFDGGMIAVLWALSGRALGMIIPGFKFSPAEASRFFYRYFVLYKFGFSADRSPEIPEIDFTNKVRYYALTLAVWLAVSLMLLAVAYLYFSRLSPDKLGGISLFPLGYPFLIPLFAVALTIYGNSYHDALIVWLACAYVPILILIWLRNPILRRRQKSKDDTR